MMDSFVFCLFFKKRVKIDAAEPQIYFVGCRFRCVGCVVPHVLAVSVASSGGEERATEAAHS